MFKPTRHRLRKAIVVLAALAAAGVSAFVFIQPAASHGTATSPPSRQYSCWERWGDDHLNPDMADTDPMCAQAWQANPNTMWNWNGLLREGMQGQHESRIPDNQLCSGGRAEGGRYNSLDVAGAWHTTPLENNFTLHYEDTAVHGGDYYWVYVSRQGYDATTDSLDWADLERVVSTGVYEPGEAVDIPVSAPGRTGRHVVYVIWQASHLDQTFYSCSDVWFGGGGPTEEPTDPTEDPTEEPTEEPTGGPAGYACDATATVNGWGSGATVTVKVANTGTQAIHNWMLHWQWPSGVTMSDIWNASHSTMGTSEMAEPVEWNKAIPVGGSVEFGLNITGSLSGAPEFDCLPS